MAHFIDRRLNPKDKSLGNRRRFVRRVRSHVKDAVNEAVRQRSVADIDQGEKVSVPSGGISEPSFQHARDSGRRESVFTGNKSFKPGDRIKKPRRGGGRGGRLGSPEGESEDEFLFVLSREEFLDIFLEDLELPDMVKRTLSAIKSERPRRAGFSVAGAPANINIKRTMRNAVGRQLALGRPSKQAVRALREAIFALESISAPSESQRAELKALRTELQDLLRRKTIIPFIDPLDIRYNYFQTQHEPNSNAVMFCLMDVSASMGEREKDLAKRFFVLLHMFLTRRYDTLELVFIRHTHSAAEVDEETFFHSRETGGTVVSTALEEMRRIIAGRYPVSEWNIYAAQASDGENVLGDSAACAGILDDHLLSVCQYFAYIEIVEEAEAPLLASEESGMDLWRAYRKVALTRPNFAMKRISRPADIYPVFRSLFARRNKQSSHVS